MFIKIAFIILTPWISRFGKVLSVVRVVFVRLHACCMHLLVWAVQMCACEGQSYDWCLSLIALTFYILR